MTDNILEHEKDFAALIDGFDLTIPGKDSSLGKDLANEQAKRIQERTVHDQQDADGNTLPPNSEAWTKYKKAGWGIEEVGYWTGQTLSHQSLLGETEIAAESVSMAHGVGQPATEFFDGSPYPPPVKNPRKGSTAQPPTDREKLKYLTDRKGTIYAFGPGDKEALTAVVAEALKEYIDGAT